MQEEHDRTPKLETWQVIVIVIIFFLAATQLADIDEYFRPWRYRY